MIYTEKQAELMRIFKQNKLKRLNILHGSIRSGKTWVSLVLWAFWVAVSPSDRSYLMVAKTLTSLKRNCLDLLESLVGKRNFQYSISQKQAWLFGRKVYLEGVNDARAESKIRGMTLQGAYCDELTLFTEDFFSMLLSRLSEKNAKLFATTNPDTPNHWLKVNYIDRKDKLDMLVMQFLIDDNTTLDLEYVKQIKAENQGVFYDRFILGKWVNAEGLIYPMFANNTKEYIVNDNDIPKLQYINIGVDFGGNKSNHAFVATGFDEDFKNLYCLESSELKAEGTTVPYLTEKFINFCEGIEKLYGFIDCIYPDSAEQTIINTLKSSCRWNVRNSLKRPINDRIRCEDMLIGQKRLKILKGRNDVLIKALSEAVWNDKKWEDERLDDGTSDIDVLDAFEYSFERYIKRLIREE